MPSRRPRGRRFIVRLNVASVEAPLDRVRSAPPADRIHRSHLQGGSALLEGEGASWKGSIGLVDTFCSSHGRVREARNPAKLSRMGGFPKTIETQEPSKSVVR